MKAPKSHGPFRSRKLNVLATARLICCGRRHYVGLTDKGQLVFSHHTRKEIGILLDLKTFGNGHDCPCMKVLDLFRRRFFCSPEMPAALQLETALLDSMVNNRTVNWTNRLASRLARRLRRREGASWRPPTVAAVPETSPFSNLRGRMILETLLFLNERFDLPLAQDGDSIVMKTSLISEMRLIRLDPPRTARTVEVKLDSEYKAALIKETNQAYGTNYLVMATLAAALACLMRSAVERGKGKRMAWNAKVMRNSGLSRIREIHREDRERMELAATSIQVSTDGGYHRNSGVGVTLQLNSITACQANRICLYLQREVMPKLAAMVDASDARVMAGARGSILSPPFNEVRMMGPDKGGVS